MHGFHTQGETGSAPPGGTSETGGQCGELGVTMTKVMGVEQKAAMLFARGDAMASTKAPTRAPSVSSTIMPTVILEEKPTSTERNMRGVGRLRKVKSLPQLCMAAFGGRENAHRA